MWSLKFCPALKILWFWASNKKQLSFSLMFHPWTRTLSSFLVSVYTWLPSFFLLCPLFSLMPLKLICFVSSLSSYIFLQTCQVILLVSSSLCPCLPPPICIHAPNWNYLLEFLWGPPGIPYHWSLSQKHTFLQSQRIRYSVAQVTNLLSGYRYCFLKDHT